MTETWTIRKVVRWSEADFSSRGIPSPRLDAELLVSHGLGIDRVKLYMDLDRPLTGAELGVVRELVQRRRRREPIAYILGRREFWSRAFEVGPDVLIPRPETETLVEHALSLLTPERSARVLDLCTGSGCIGVTLAAERPHVRAVLTDLSRAALAVARRNAEKHGVLERTDFAEGDLFAAVPPEARFDVVTANPPYLSELDLSECAPDVREHEPKIALVAGARGDETLARIAAGASAHLEPGGQLLVEIGAGQGASVAALFASAGLLDVRVLWDLAGLSRVVVARRA